MPKNKDQKTKLIEELKTNFNQAKGVAFVDYKGLSVKDVEELRKELRDNQITYVVAKKTLTNIALKEADIKEVDARKLEGQMAMAFSSEDEILPAKLLHKFAKTHESITLLGGLIAKKFVGQSEISALALLPGKQELLARMVGSIGAPLSGLVRVLQGNINGLVYALKAIADKKGN